MFLVNKLVWFFLNPVMLPLAVALFGFALLRWSRARRSLRRLGWACLFAAFAFFYFTSTTACVALLGLPLERPYLATERAESLPEADAIVVLGGGMFKSEAMAYPDMNASADRVWHAARLYKAVKAPKVIVSGANDLEAAVPLLIDLGVPREAIEVDNASRNTYENSRFTERLLGEGKRVLLVTSAWHMPRACGNFSRTSLEVTPAAADFTVSNAVRFSPWRYWLLPSPGNADLVNVLAKEWLGRFARK